MLLIGLDRFRAVNDTHGHAAGDEVLIEVATRLHQVLDVAQPLARVGGDEFAVLAECDDERDAAELAERLARALDPPLEAGFPVTAAIGIAIEEPGHAHAPTSSRAPTPRCSASRPAAATRSRSSTARWRAACATGCGIEDGLRRAIAQGRAAPRLPADPAASTRCATVALEALVRWQHPEQGLLGPGRFLPVAEQNARLISAIGHWVLHRACIESRLFPERRPRSASTSPRAS